jgi:nucleoid DNA-binding protein
MKKSGLAMDVARRSGVKLGDAADQLDSVVNQILRILKDGRPAHIPGLGTIIPGKRWRFEQEHHES